MWPEVAKSYYRSFSRAREEHVVRRRSVFEAKTLAKRHVALPEANAERHDELAQRYPLTVGGVFRAADEAQSFVAAKPNR